MAYAFPSAGALDYAMCRYGTSKLLFRGPKRSLDRVFVAVIGGSDCFGRYVRYPFPDLIEKDLGLPVANFGLHNAGPDVYLNDEWLMEATRRAAVTVVQIMGAQNISNRFFTVHPRRNDRFIAPTPALQALYPKLDMTEIHFTKHLLQALHHQSPTNFATVAQGLREDWMLHMTNLLAQIGSPTIVFWSGDAMPPPQEGPLDLFASHLLIARQMVDTVAQRADRLVYAIASPEARAASTEGMIFDPIEMPFAMQLAGPYVHRELSDTLLPHIEDLLAAKPTRRR